MAVLEVVDEDSTTDIQILSRNIPSTIGGSGIYISSPGTENLQLSLPLGATFSSYDAEVAAASSVLEHLPDLAANSHVLLCTDSKSVLDTLQGNISRAGPQTQLLWDNIRSKLDKRIAITAVWVPAHCGIPENELAGQLATKATKRPFSENCVARLAPEVVRTFTRRKQLSKLIRFRDDDEYKFTVSRRKAEVTPNQLRANCSPLVRDFTQPRPMTQYAKHVYCASPKQLTISCAIAQEEQLHDENILARTAELLWKICVPNTVRNF